MQLTNRELIQQLRNKWLRDGYKPKEMELAADAIESLSTSLDITSKQRDASNRRIEELQDENYKLKQAIECYEQALTCSWPEGALGDAFEYWNSARRITDESI